MTQYYVEQHQIGIVVQCMSAYSWIHFIEIWHKIEIPVIEGHFVPVYPFWTILSKLPAYNRL